MINEYLEDHLREYTGQMNKATMYDLEREQFDIIKWNLRKPHQDTGKKKPIVSLFGVNWEIVNVMILYYKL